MSLNSVVNKLVRAAASVPTDISDTDLDRHVAQLLADEAKARELKWSEMGLSALIDSGSGRSSPDPSAPKPNKRFLASIIRTVDGHNRDLLRSQAQAARDVREEKYGEPSKAGRSGASRLFGGALRGMGNGAESGSSVHRRDARRDVGRRSRSPDDTRRSSRPVTHDDGEHRRRGERYEPHSLAPHTSRREREDRSPQQLFQKRAQDSTRQGRRRASSGSSEGTERRTSDRRRRVGALHSEQGPKRRRSPSPQSPSSPALSKMDKYFAQTYDPRTDVGEVPPEGMIADVGWDNMLAILKDRGQKKRRNSPGLLDDPYEVPPKAIARSASPDEKSERRRRKDERRRKYIEDSDDDFERTERRRRRKEERRKSQATEAVEKEGKINVLGMEYTRKGGVREWDKGK